MKNFENRLTGGHPNSLGNTIEIVEEVLSNQALFEELFQCYFSSDEVVRLRVSNAMKRICISNQSYLIPYTDRILNEISQIDQASTKWTLATLFEMLKDDFSDQQFQQAKSIIKHNLETDNDWIVLNNSIETLSKWSLDDADLLDWLLPRLEKHAKDDRNSVAKRASKWLAKLKK